MTYLTGLTGYQVNNPNLTLGTSLTWVEVIGATPSAPTNFVGDNSLNTFNFTNVIGYPSNSDYEYSLNSGSTYNPVTVRPIPLGDTSKTIGEIYIRVKEQYGRNPSLPLTSTVAFSSDSTTLLPVTSWGFGENYIVSGNSVNSNSGQSGYGWAASAKYIPIGGIGEVRCDFNTADGGIIGLVNGTSRVDDNSSFLFGIRKQPDGKFIYRINGVQAGTANGFPVNANTKGRVRTTGSVVKIEYTTDSGTSWTQLGDDYPQPNTILNLHVAYFYPQQVNNNIFAQGII